MDPEDVRIWFGVISLIVVGGRADHAAGRAQRGQQLDGARRADDRVLPFLASDAVRVALIVGFPASSLWLPSLLRV